MKSGRQLMFSAACLLLIAVPAFAQDGEAKLIDEVIARVNANVIMRSAFEAAQKQYLEKLKSDGLKPEEIEKEFAKFRPFILDQLINTQLVSQRGKDLSVNVEPQVNQQLLRLMKENNCESQDCLSQKMREAGVSIEEFKQIMNDNFMKEAVLSREVYQRRYRDITEKEKREVYEKNKSMFVQPAELKLSRIFVGLGKDPAAATARADSIAKQAKVGSLSFATLASSLSEEPLGKSAGGSMGEAYKINELAPEVMTALQKLPNGSITDPVKLDTGYYIFKVDDRKEEVQLPFDDEKVQSGIANYVIGQHAEKDIEEFHAKLREDAFIEIDPRYQFENAKVRSAEIKRVPFMDEKERKQLEKEQKKQDELKKKQPKKVDAAPKTAKNN